VNRIRLLPEQVANQIAAGEVVERPASVVKELVENSLDADARKITVEIGAGGRSLIRVTDDGWGMSRDDALLSLERHATSKIQKAEDLASIATMGFRGEAVPSIASVSRFTLTTRERDSQSPEGTQIIINGGTMVEVKAAGGAPGTCVEVRQLFFNLPARRKFMRTEETEAAHIQHYLTLAALAYSEVAFSFVKDGRNVWQLPAIKSERSPSSRIEALRERLRALMGDEKLLPVNFIASLEDIPIVPDETDIFENASPEKPESVTSPDQVRVWGLIGTPGVSRATRDGQFVFVNRRPVENRGINYALIEGYHTSLMKGRYPVCCLFLEINPASVDVNIHPAKREVKFHREFEVRKIVARAVGDSLLAYHTDTPKISPVGRADQSSEPDLEQPEILPDHPIAKPDQATVSPFKLGSLPVPLPPDLVPAVASVVQAPLKMGFGPSVSSRPEASRPETTPPNHSSAAAPLSPLPAQRPAGMPLPAAPTGGTPLLKVPLRLIGVVGKLYVLLESDRGLVLLDQHAAHERILFEQMLARLEQNGSTPSQKLLLPETIELPPRDAQFLRDQLTALTRLGVGLSEFGERTFLLDALPPFVRAADPRRFVFDLVDELRAAGREVNLARLGEHTVAKTVCRHAVKANDYLAAAELENLINDLRHCAMPYTCPHGRPTLIEMNYRELEKKFGRTQ
jgi:DNA mismatch repair protein MutL